MGKRESTGIDPLAGNAHNRIPREACAKYFSALAIGLAASDPATRHALSGCELSEGPDGTARVSCASSGEDFITGRPVPCRYSTTLRVAPKGGTVELTPEAVHAIPHVCMRELESATEK